MFRRSCGLVALAASSLIALPALAGDFSFDVPALTGLYEGAQANRNVDLDLDMPFAQIDGISLRLAGNHTPGSIMLLQPGAPEEPYPAEVVGVFPEAGPFFTTAFDALLPAAGGPFDITFNFDNLNRPAAEPNFDPLLDGKARLHVSVGGPPVIAIYRILSGPTIDVDSATLLISGQPELDTFMLPGDYDRSGSVDAADFIVWRATWGSSVDMRADGNGDGTIDAADYAVWRDGMGASHANSAGLIASVPEPGAVLLLAIAACSLAGCRRRRLCSAKSRNPQA